MECPTSRLGKTLRRQGALVLLALACVPVPSSALAQSPFVREGNVAVKDRPRPGYDATGVELGASDLYPKLVTRAEYQDNVLASPTDALGDYLLVVEPAVELERNSSVVALRARAGAVITRHQDLEEEDSTQWALRLDASTPPVRNLQLSALAEALHRVEPRTSAAYETVGAPLIEFDAARVGGSVSREFDTVRVILSGDFSDRAYDSQAQAFRDHRELSATVRVDYAVSPSLAVFSEGSADRRDYRASETANRDSEGFNALVGVNLELTRLITGEASIGYLSQSFEDPSYADVENFHYRMRIDWFPTQLVTVGLTAGQVVSDSGIETVAGVVSRDLGLTVDYELLRNLILRASLTRTADDYSEIDREDERYAAEISANYLMNRSIGISLRYVQTDQTSSGAAAGNTFDDRRIGVALVLQR